MVGRQEKRVNLTVDLLPLTAAYLEKWNGYRTGEIIQRVENVRKGNSGIEMFANRTVICAGVIRWSSKKL